MKKIAVLIGIILLGASKVRALKIDFLFTVTPAVLWWIHYFYKAYGRYPEDVDELVTKNPRPKDYNSAWCYKNYIECSFDIIYNKDLLIFIVIQNNLSKGACICGIKGKKYYYYDENNRLDSIEYAL